MSESLKALRSANPRHDTAFAEVVEAAHHDVRARIALEHQVAAAEPTRPRHPRRHLRTSLVAATAILVAFSALLAAGSFTGGTGVESASAAVTKAATLTAASAEESGVAVVRMTHHGEPWAGKTIRWNGSDVAITSEDPGRDGKVGTEWLVVDGHLYGLGGPDAPGWVDFGSPNNIDPDSGTTPAETLAAAREDVGGATLRRITTGMRGLTSSALDDGSTVYRGLVPSGVIARETGFKEGQTIRVLPFGYVANDEAANPTSPLDVAVTVQEGFVREISVSWGATTSPWTYTVTYSGLGATPAPKAPANARSILELRKIR